MAMVKAQRPNEQRIGLDVCGARFISMFLVAGGSVSLAGCCGAPSLTIAGAYFPAWLLCAVIAVVVAIVSRSVMVATGLSNIIPFQLAVCSSLGALAALAIWRLWAVH
jgi:hypothetical protein